MQRDILAFSVSVCMGRKPQVWQAALELGSPLKQPRGPKLWQSEGFRHGVQVGCTEAGDEFWCTCTAGVHPHSERLWVSNQGENKTDAWHNPERKTDKGLLACLG